MKNRYEIEPYSCSPYRRGKLIDENGHSYSIPMFTKFKIKFVPRYFHIDFGSEDNSRFVVASNSFESEEFSYLIADPEKPNILEANNGGNYGRMMIFDLKKGAHSPLYYRLSDPRSSNLNTQERCVAVDLETGHIVEIDQNYYAFDTGLEIIIDRKRDTGDPIKDAAFSLDKIFLSSYETPNFLFCKNQNNKYLIYSLNYKEEMIFKKFIDKEFENTCEVTSKKAKDGNPYVFISDGDNRYVYDEKGNKVGEFSLNKNITL